MCKIMYEDVWHFIEGTETLLCCTVRPVTVTRAGILPGCTLPTIDIRREGDPHLYSASPENFFASKQAAWEHIRQELVACVADHEERAAETQAQLAALRGVLDSLPNAENQALTR